MKIFIIRAGLVGAVCVLLLWPALFNGQYFWFTDSVAYLSGASRAVLELLGLQNELGAALNGTSNIAQAQLPSTAPVTLADPGAGSEPRAPVIYGGRSPYYGLLLYLPTFFGSLWVSVMLQVAAVIVCIATALRPVFGPGSLHVRLVLIGLVAALTSVSFFTVYLMPDIFLAILILSTASLVAFWSDHSRVARCVLLALIFIACIFHKAHLVLFIGMLVAIGAFVLVVPSARRPATPFLGMVGVLASAAILTAAVPRVITNTIGAQILDPPFLTARVVTDGPGMEYLRTACPQGGYVLCDHLEHLPQGMDEFLWASNGVYKMLSVDEQIAMSRQETGFVMAAVGHAPLDQVRASAGNVMDQLLSIDLTEFAILDGLIDTLALRLPDAIAYATVESRLANGTLDLQLISLLQAVIVIASVVHLLVFLATRNRVARPGSAGPGALHPQAGRVAGFVVMILLGVVLNAIVFGTLSEPHDRYQARIIWLLPLASLMLIFMSWRIGGQRVST